MAYFLRRRYYDPLTGRFLQRDQFISASRDHNCYAYVGNEPTSFVDPSGNVRVEVRFQRLGEYPVFVPWVGGWRRVMVPYYHALILVHDNIWFSDTSGVIWYFRGGPHHWPRDLLGVIMPGAFGSLIGTTRIYRPGTVDWDPAWRTLPVIGIYDNYDRPYWYLLFLRVITLELTRLNLTYDIVSKNSNAFVGQAIEELSWARGTPKNRPPLPRRLSAANVPGWTVELRSIRTAYADLSDPISRAYIRATLWLTERP
jgi:hypothetical protein